jgi:hypothetical protein
MATIIASRFQLKEQAELVIEQLIQVGFDADKITSFYVNPPGQHAVYPIGGDRYQSPGVPVFGHRAENVSLGVTVVETVIGTEPVKDMSIEGKPGDQHETAPLRRAGMLVAVELDDRNFQDRAVTFLEKLGAEDIEKSEGKIIEGEWLDFDPLSAPSYL